MDDAKRIYAFAYKKTGDAREAEDLSQEILLALFTSGMENAENRTAYLYGVCRHVWARYLSRNKPHWEATRYESALEYLADGRDVSDEIEKSAEYAHLRREIALLSRTRREALIMRYFEGKSDAEIAQALSISPATVRWHLYKARDELKGRLQMEARNGMRAPIQLQVGHSGNVLDLTMCGLRGDLLTQNIVWACYGKPAQAEDVARELDVPAVYVESALTRLAEMDYVKEANGKYSTNFFIHTPEYLLQAARFNYEHTLPLADAFFGAARAALAAIRDIGFIGSALPENELLWHVLPELIMRAYQKANERLHETLNLRHGRPLRPDGSRHWVWARTEPAPKSGDAELDDFLENGRNYGIKGRTSADGTLESMQYDFHHLGPWREFNAAELLMASRVAKVMAGGPADEKAKEAIAALTRDGYVENGKLMIPYMTKPERRTYNEGLDEAIATLDMDALYAPFEGYAREMGRLMPAFLNPNERAHRLTSFDPFNGSIYHLVKAGKLTLPEPNIAQRLSTVVWENT
jgi:RNA polymerase sigma factor (sigma-70 family)